MNEDVIRNEILQGLRQVDETFTFSDFYIDFDKSTRKLKVSFSASTESGETVSEVLNYA